MIKEKIALNFLPIDNQNFQFSIWIRLFKHSEERPKPSIKKYKLPDEKGVYKHFWVSFEEFQDSENKEISSNTNIELTKFYLFKLLETKLKETDIKFEQREKEINYAPNHIYIITEETALGRKTIRIEPYYLKRSEKFGFLVDYRFLKKHDVELNREVQKLSFSLDDNYKSNVNYHIDKYNYVLGYINKYLDKFSLIREDIRILKNFECLDYEKLQLRTYIFNNFQRNSSQFNGIMKYGPYKPYKHPVKYIYIYLEKYKDYANDLIKALNGKVYETFMGLEKLKVSIQTKENTIGIQLKSYDEDPKTFLSNINVDENSMIIAIIPKKERKFYYNLKNYCLRQSIPLQVVNLETIIDEYKLKWSVSGIALQMLAKLGGVPWIVKSENTDCLIVGIGQSIKRSNDRPKKFLAHAVLLNSSGEFLTIEPLANENTKDAYISKISEKIAEILKKYSKYKKVVFHIPEKIKLDTIDKIKNVLRNNSQENIELYIIRVNDNSKFFGYAINNNSLIPYEGSYVQLSHKEFLLWTEGLNYNNPTPKKRYGNPLYIDFYYSNQKSIDYKSFLQDILNLSGVNYRGFNAKSLPVSMYYPKLISDFYKHYNFSLRRGNKRRCWYSHFVTDDRRS